MTLDDALDVIRGRIDAVRAKAKAASPRHRVGYEQAALELQRVANDLRSATIVNNKTTPEVAFGPNNRSR